MAVVKLGKKIKSKISHIVMICGLTLSIFFFSIPSSTSKAAEGVVGVSDGPGGPTCCGGVTC